MSQLYADRGTRSTYSARLVTLFQMLAWFFTYRLMYLLLIEN